MSLRLRLRSPCWASWTLCLDVWYYCAPRQCHQLPCWFWHHLAPSVVVLVFLVMLPLLSLLLRHHKHRCLFVQPHTFSVGASPKTSQCHSKYRVIFDCGAAYRRRGREIGQSGEIYSREVRRCGGINGRIWRRHGKDGG